LITTAEDVFGESVAIRTALYPAALHGERPIFPYTHTTATSPSFALDGVARNRAAFQDKLAAIAVRVLCP
jgi:hypothetical protein